MVAIETLEKTGNAWTHPKTGEVRYYIDAEKVADMAGISGTAYGRGDRALSRTEFGRLLGCKFWLDTEGELHIKGCMPLTLIEGMKTAEDLIRGAVAQVIAEAEPAEETETVTTEVIAAPVEAEATCTCGGSEDHENRIIINTPNGLRYIDVPDYQGETLWEAIAKYDAVNGTDLEERLEIEDIVAAGQESSAYSCSPLSFPDDLRWAYSFVQHNGNCGSEQGFATLKEAMDEAEIAWDHLTDREKVAYSGPGCYFMVIEGEISEGGDIGTIIRDFTEPEERITEWTGTERISSQGNSLSVSITKACRLMGLDKGDVVEVTIRRKD